MVTIHSLLCVVAHSAGSGKTYNAASSSDFTAGINIAVGFDADMGSAIWRGTSTAMTSDGVEKDQLSLFHYILVL